MHSVWVYAYIHHNQKANSLQHNYRTGNQRMYEHKCVCVCVPVRYPHWEWALWLVGCSRWCQEMMSWNGEMQGKGRRVDREEEEGRGRRLVNKHIYLFVCGKYDAMVKHDVTLDWRIRILRKGRGKLTTRVDIMVLTVDVMMCSRSCIDKE